MADITQSEFEQHLDTYESELRKKGLRSGPEYSGDGDSKPLVWYDQAFARAIPPAGTYECPTALRVGSTQNGLDVMLVGSHANTTTMAIPKDATITMTMLAADAPDGVFVETGPSICVKAPTGGIAVEPDGLAVRFAIGNFKKPWLKVKLVFVGSITGGTLDCVLGYVPR